MSKNIKNAVFDIGMVLIDFAWRATMVESGFDEKCIKTLDEGFVNDELWDELDLGVMEEKDVIEEAVRRFGKYEKEIRFFYDNLIKTVRPYPYSETWLKNLKERGFNVYLLTNYPDSLFKKSVESAFPFYPYVDGEVVSSRVKIRKPNEGIYKALFEKYNLKPEECVFFDDRIINVEAAKKLGMNAFVFEGYEKAVSDLDKLVNGQ